LTNVELSLHIPEELIARAEAEGIKSEDLSHEFIAFLEGEIHRRQRDRHLLETAAHLRTLSAWHKSISGGGK